MSKEIARFQLTSGVNNLERWVIPDNVNVITENTDSTHYTETYQHKFYNSAIINFDTSLYGHLWASSMLLFDASCQITVERSTNGGSTWSSYRTTNFQTLRGSFYTSSGGDSGIGGTYWINMNSNDAQCISSVLPICNNATDFNNAVTNVYVPEITSGGAGSGYIGNTLVSNKKMVGYNVPTSSAESTKTESVNEASESPVSGKPKIGNGYAKIKLIKEAPIPPSNYIAWLDPEFGVNNLVISKPLQATNVKVVEDYYVADTSSSWSSFIVIPVNMPFTSDIDLIIDLDVYVGNEDNENSTDYGFELYFNLNRNNNRVLGMTMRNSRWASGANINYDIWGNTELHGISSVFDNTNNNYKWVNLKIVLGFRSGQWVSSKSYIDDTLFQEYTYSEKNMGNNDIDNIETALPANACTYRIKSYKIYTQTPS